MLGNRPKNDNAYCREKGGMSPAIPPLCKSVENLGFQFQQ